MLSSATEFPQAGSAAFVKGSADPVTILQHVGSDCMVRREPRARELRNRPASSSEAVGIQARASGTTRIPRADLFATEDEALAGPAPRHSRKATSPRRQRKGRR